ncbi:primosomal protein [Acinetobacter baumannii]|uniref:helix-turn-helix domain-containing protein n=1 Tax=Acinetobacter calcoaceticus/baumannii complex TaxID=909768 RepID=UPI000718A189|nr:MULTISPECIES: helix-turn-helix domain-containing protein [Acinetobacter calcoaceticus/baumannii complex]KRW27815.1 primosomal protein [Acinetobacter baumannii]MCG5255823.1 helix-turn-helix domain-containing protein [Acinetobacter pittii]MDA5696201.1 helix-turn-helix domain-containing protein [Acinetobacter baumannii]MDC4384268.1 helix-turn-helix domain-containing protein [Acinetobacter baumannii]OTK91535.1 helix-turn-helix domain-containing protein [Acinetobacter baumannii]
MSIDAIRWSWTASVKTSAQRLVLLSLADRAGEEHTAWPSIDRLAADTMLDKKTVQKVILELIKLGLVSDTGERTGPTKRVRILKLNGVKGREEYNQNLNNSASKNNTKSRTNVPKNGNIKHSQKRNDSDNGNIPENGILNNPQNGTLNVPNFGMQNQPLNLPINLSQEHDWIPNVDQLMTKIKMAGHGQNIDLIFGLPSFEFELSAFNSYFENSGLSDSKKLHKFTAWIVDKFERYKKQNPAYGIHPSLETGQQAITARPFINLPTKPKSLLGDAQ